MSPLMQQLPRLNVTENHHHHGILAHRCAWRHLHHGSVMHSARTLHS